MKLLPVKVSFFAAFLLVFQFILISQDLCSQTDENPPVSPVFEFVTINPTDGMVEMKWQQSASPDVAGYVIYLYRNNEGYAIDTVPGRDVLAYSVSRPFTRYFSESYVIAAIDSSGNVSPLSNDLQTIHTETSIDTCNKKMLISWNEYLSVPQKVTGYDVLASVNNNTYYLAGHVTGDVTSLILDDFQNNATYCIFVNAILENGSASSSNKSCLLVRTQIVPSWINADFATISSSGELSLSFTIDPVSETHTYSLERRIGYSGAFLEIGKFTTSSKTISYTDKSASTEIVNFYRLWAINTCNIPVITSNLASNIVLTSTVTGQEIILEWNKYRDWSGSVSSYRLFADSGDGFSEMAVIDPADTTFKVNIPEVMYNIKQDKVCFYLTADETGNPYSISGETVSNKACSEINEVITVPNAFTPDGDLKNDLFRPVLTFTPAEYRMIISNRQGKLLFETRDFLESWDGTDKGDPVNEGVYLWFLELKTREGKSITRTGSVTVIKN